MRTCVRKALVPGSALVLSKSTSVRNCEGHAGSLLAEALVPAALHSQAGDGERVGQRFAQSSIRNVCDLWAQ